MNKILICPTIDYIFQVWLPGVCLGTMFSCITTLVYGAVLHVEPYADDYGLIFVYLFFCAISIWIMIMSIERDMILHRKRQINFERRFNVRFNRLPREAHEVINIPRLRKRINILRLYQDHGIVREGYFRKVNIMREKIVKDCLVIRALTEQRHYH